MFKKTFLRKRFQLVHNDHPYSMDPVQVVRQGRASEMYYDGSADDPDRLWCICKQPYNNRFMICCDTCNDWFHGTCVKVSKAMAKEFERIGKEWSCIACQGEVAAAPKQVPASSPVKVVHNSVGGGLLSNPMKIITVATAPTPGQHCNSDSVRSDDSYQFNATHYCHIKGCFAFGHVGIELCKLNLNRNVCRDLSQCVLNCNPPCIFGTFFDSVKEEMLCINKIKRERP